MSNRPKSYAWSGIGALRGRMGRLDKGRRLGPVTGRTKVQNRKAEAAQAIADRTGRAEARKVADEAEQAAVAAKAKPPAP